MGIIDLDSAVTSAFYGIFASKLAFYSSRVPCRQCLAGAGHRGVKKSGHQGLQKRIFLTGANISSCPAYRVSPRVYSLHKSPVLLTLALGY